MYICFIFYNTKKDFYSKNLFYNYKCNTNIQMGNFSSNSVVDSNTHELNAKAANKMIKKKYFNLILDVRSYEERSNGFYANSLHMPLDKIERKFAKMYPDKNIKVLIYCASGNRAIGAKNVLNISGYKNVYVLLNSSYDKLIEM